MRDPERIAVIVHWLLALWRKCPDLRFGQLVSNVASIGEGRRLNHSELFNMEDVEWEQKFYKQLLEVEEDEQRIKRK